MFLLYQICMVIIIILATPILFYKGIFGSKGFTERFGNWKYQPSSGKVIWFHAASMGELKAIAAIIPLLRKSNPDIKPVITTITKTGRNKAKDLDMGADVYYAPLDLGFTVKKAIGLIKPSLLILVETEIWPSMITTANKAGIPIVIANARLSCKSSGNYKYVKPFMKAILNKIDLIMAQSDEDAARFLSLGAPEKNVQVFGNIKFDQVANHQNGMIAEDLAGYLDRSNNFVFIAGSVREKEINPVVDAITANLANLKKLTAVIAVRHLKNLNLLESALKQKGLSYIKRSELKPPANNIATPDILVLDTMGELAGLYSKADLSFVGGSLIPIGGHDPLEPASAGCAVCFGPYMENSLSASRQLLESGGARQVSDSQQLKNLIAELSANRTLAKSMGDKSRQMVLKHTGVAQRIVTKLTEYL